VSRHHGCGDCSRVTTEILNTPGFCAVKDWRRAWGQCIRDVRARNNGATSQAGDVHRQWENRVKPDPSRWPAPPIIPTAAVAPFQRSGASGTWATQKNPRTRGPAPLSAGGGITPGPANAADIVLAFPIMASQHGFPAWPFAETAPNKAGGAGFRRRAANRSLALRARQYPSMARPSSREAPTPPHPTATEGSDTASGSRRG
jgi:hypothetical protein